MHFLDILDHSAEELEMILSLSAELKARLKSGDREETLRGRTLAMYFEKPSLRTVVSLATAMTSMGGSYINLDLGGRALGLREAIFDQARVMSRYVDIISIRCFSHDDLREFAKHSGVPVINALTDRSHPTQAMADMMTMREHLGSTGGKTLACLGRMTNVSLSLAEVCAKLGMRFVGASPKGYGFEAGELKAIRAACPGADIRLAEDPAEAVAEASAIYADVWASMGQTDDPKKLREALLPYQVNAALLEKAPPEAIVMHCMPAHRGEEISDDGIDSRNSVVIDQAENRMHLNRGLFMHLLGRG